LLPLRQQSLDARLQHAHKSSFRSCAGHERVEYLADPVAHGDRRQSVRHFALNFSRPGSEVILQYWMLASQGRDGYRQIMQGAQEIATYISGEIAEMGPYRLISEGRELPVFAFALKQDVNRLAEVVVTEPTGSETQVVARSGDHDIVCVFRERVMPKPGEYGPDPGGSITQWHMHDNVCFSAGGMVVGVLSPFGTCPAGSFNAPTAYMMHVWTAGNPNGAFGELNNAWVARLVAQ